MSTLLDWQMIWFKILVDIIYKSLFHIINDYKSLVPLFNDDKCIMRLKCTLRHNV